MSSSQNCLIAYCGDLERNITINDHTLNDIIFAYVRNPVRERIMRQINGIRRSIGITQNRSVYGMYFQSLFDQLVTVDITDLDDKWHFLKTGTRIQGEIQGVMITYSNNGILDNKSIFIYNCQSCGSLLRPSPDHIDQCNHFMVCENENCSQMIVFR